MDIWIIEGRNDSRKSTVIRCLSGAAWEKQYDIEMLFGGIVGTHQVYVFTSAPNERNPIFTPQQLVQFLTAEAAKKVLLPLRPTRRAGTSQYPAVDYYTHFLTQGHTIQAVAKFGSGTGTIPNTAPNYSIYPNSGTDAANSTASSLRQRWSWI